MKMIRRYVREPAMHFVALGALVFGLHRWVAPPPPHRIVVSAPVLQALRVDHLRRTGAMPNDAEEAALVRGFADDEMLYREALALGLDRGDVIVRRRLVQKMEFLAEAGEPGDAPDETELRRYLEEHADRYRLPERVALRHVFVSTRAHGDDVERVAREILVQLQRGAEPPALGDPFLRGNQIALSTETQIASIFGSQFAAEAMKLADRTWSEPLRSSYGLHLVEITARSAAHVPDLAEVRGAVVGDFLQDRRADRRKSELERLRRRYQVVVDRRGAETAVAAAP